MSDLIDRQAAIDAIMSVKRTDNLKSVAMLIMDLPSAQPERKTGRWMFQTITQGKRMRCSNCNSFFDLCCNQVKQYDEATKKDYLWAYCPWCGSRMEGAANE